MGRECPSPPFFYVDQFEQSSGPGHNPLPGAAAPDGPAALGQDVQPVPSSVAVQDGLVARRVQHQRFPLLRPGRGCAATRVPDAGALAECGVPRVGRVVLRPLYAPCDLRWAVEVDKILPAVCQLRPP